jgi:TonB family protein
MANRPMTSAALVTASFAAIWASTISAQELPPIPADLIDSTAVTCIKISVAGAVEDAFIVQSTGDQTKDAEVLKWVRQLHWAKAGPGEKLRNTWFPMPVAFGSVTSPKMPASCSPEQAQTSAS